MESLFYKFQRIEVIGGGIEDELPGFFNEATIQKLIGSTFVKVEYTRLTDSVGVPVVKALPITQIRPLPPSRPADIFDIEDNVDIETADGWRHCRVIERRGQHYRVVFPFVDDGWYHSSLLRPHFEWVGNTWRMDTKYQLIELDGDVFNVREYFNVNQDIELLGSLYGLVGSYSPARITKLYDGFYAEVEYVHFVEEDGRDIRLLEIAHFCRVRPVPPISAMVEYELNEEVDVWWRDTWWHGRVTTSDHPNYLIMFDLYLDAIWADLTQLRAHSEYKNGSWYFNPKYNV